MAYALSDRLCVVVAIARIALLYLLSPCGNFDLGADSIKIHLLFVI